VGDDTRDNSGREEVMGGDETSMSEGGEGERQGNGTAG